MTPRLLDTDAAATYLGVSAPTIRRLVSRAALVPVRVSVGRRRG